MMIDIIRFSASTIMLVVASYLDLKYREISDLLWLIFGVLGLVLNGYEFYINSLPYTNFLVSILIIIIIGFVINYFQLLGEADILAFVTLTFLNPRHVNLSTFNFYVAPLIFSLTLFSNSILLSSSSVIINAIQNLMKYFQDKTIFDGRKYSLTEKILLFFTSNKKTFSDIKGPPFDYPVEYFHDGEKKLMIRVGLQDDDSAQRIFNEFRSKDVKVVWVSSTLPFILFITAGYLATFMLGDLMFLILDKII